MTTPSSRLRTVLDRLPFAVDDTDAANEAFRRWQTDDAAEAKRVVDLWTYCYVCRYFLGKSAGGNFDSAAAPEQLITRAYEKVRDKRDTVRNPDRYASWVSVVCKNTFLNHTRRDRRAQSIDEEKGPTLRADERGRSQTVGFVQESLEAAIDRLPNYLQEPARLYFLEDRDFEEISEAVDKPVPTIRTYKHKAVQRLREDETLREYVDGTES
jgi:RNA polymerase sigma factor (sigma-70 family)